MRKTFSKNVEDIATGGWVGARKIHSVGRIEGPTMEKARNPFES